MPPSARPRLEFLPAAPERYSEVAAVALAAYHDAYEVSAEYAADIQATARRAVNYEIWIARTPTGTVAGTFSLLRQDAERPFNIRRDEQYFRLLAVDPAFHRQGIGTALVRFIIDESRRRGAQAVSLHSGPAMLQAHRLYQSLGFERAPERESFEDESGEQREIPTFVLPLS